MSSPTSRSLDRLRETGWTPQVVEKTVRVPGRRPFKKDCFGFDILACKPKGPGQWGAEIIGVQACGDTGGSGMAEHRTKLLANAEAAIWLASGGRIQIWAWGKKSQGARKRWECRVEDVTLADYIPHVVVAARAHVADLAAKAKAKANQPAAPLSILP